MEELIRYESTTNGKVGAYRSATVYPYDEDAEGWPVKFFTDDGYDPYFYVYAPLSKAIQAAKDHCDGGFDPDDYMYNDSDY